MIFFINQNYQLNLLIMQNHFLQKSKEGLILLNLIFLGLNLSAQTWQQLGDPPFFKHHSNGFGFDGKAYVIEGTNQNDGPNGVSNEVWEYTASTDSWTQLADFPGEARAIAIGDDWNGKYYYGFGSSGNELLSDLWEFDPVTNTFTELPSCPCEGRTHPALVAHNDKIFMGSGSANYDDLNDWWEYDMLTQEWSQKPNIPGPNRHHPFQFAIGDFIYVGGGHVNNWIQYNPATEEWVEIDNAPQGRVAGAQFNYGGYGFVLGGDDGGHDHVPDSETFMRYDADADDWDELPSLPNGSRWAPSSFIIDTDLYFLGGLSSNYESDSSLWKFDLTILDCLPADDMVATNVTDTYAELFWDGNDNSVADTLRWRRVGDASWNVIPNPQVVFVLDNLEACEDYEFVVTSDCASLTTNSDIYTFKTDGCCTNPSISINDVSNNSSSLEWDDILAADNYDIRWRVVGSSDWNNETLNETNFELNDLTECTEYELQFKSICDIEDIDYSESIIILTKGCGACLDNEYCAPNQYLDGDYSYINEVRINNYVNTTGSDSGYGNYAIPNDETLLIGSFFTLSIEPYAEFGGDNLIAWIDFNGNGSFENNEKIVDETFVDNEVTESILIPNTATTGLTRMRIIYGYAFSYGEPTNPCDNGDYFFGEAEDYCLNIVSIINNQEELGNNQETFSVFPNPFQNTIQLKRKSSLDSKFDLTILNVIGEKMMELNQFDLSNPIDLSKVPSGIYFIQIGDESNFSQTIKVIKR